jgi:hypothetical protein
MSKSGLGQRGQDKINIPANKLFSKTDNAGNGNSSITHNGKSVAPDQPEHQVRKQYMLAFDLAEKLREQAFRERRKEVDIVREALAEYYARRENNSK